MPRTRFNGRLQWTAQHATELHAEPSRGFVVGVGRRRSRLCFDQTGNGKGPVLAVDWAVVMCAVLEAHNERKSQ